MIENLVVQQYSPNYNGEDYVVGDIHGCYTLLEQELERHDFDPTTDRLFSVGDLCDRGPESHRVIEFLKQPWFHAVCGNHDQLIIMAYEHEHGYKKQDAGFYPFWNHIGGRWWQNVTEDERAELYSHIKYLPYMIEVKTIDETIGIIHAEIPEGYSWQEARDVLSDGSKSHFEWVEESVVWGRDRVTKEDRSGVDGIDRVFCGHTVIQNIETYCQRYQLPLVATPEIVPHQLGNVNYIDTGGFVARDNGVDLPHGGPLGKPPFGLTVFKITNNKGE